MSLGEHLKKLREERNLSQVQVCKDLGIKYSALLSNYERDERTPDLGTLKKLARYYDVSLDELLRMNEPPVSREQLNLFKERLLLLRHEKKISREELGSIISKDADYITYLETEATELPSIEILYDISNYLNVTPDYLGGFTNDRKGIDSRTPKPKDLTEFIEQNMIMYKGIPLSKEDKEKLLLALQAVFYDSKYRNS